MLQSLILDGPCEEVYIFILCSAAYKQKGTCIGGASERAFRAETVTRWGDCCFLCPTPCFIGCLVFLQLLYITKHADWQVSSLEKRWPFLQERQLLLHMPMCMVKNLLLILVRSGMATKFLANDDSNPSVFVYHFTQDSDEHFVCCFVLSIPLRKI